MTNDPNIFTLDHSDYTICFIRGREAFTTILKDQDAVEQAVFYFYNEFAGVSFEELDRMKPMMESLEVA